MEFEMFELESTKVDQRPVTSANPTTYPNGALSLFLRRGGRVVLGRRHVATNLRDANRLLDQVIQVLTQHLELVAPLDGVLGHAVVHRQTGQCVLLRNLEWKESKEVRSDAKPRILTPGCSDCYSN